MDGEPTIDPEAARDVIDHGRLGPGRVGIIDVGSNSIRLVVYERASRAPLPVFNEKVLCGLARGLDATGRLNPQGVELALANIDRFTTLAHNMKVTSLDLLATAAVRDASDGRGFHARAGEPGHQGAYRERPGRGALLRLRRDVRHARGIRRDGRPGRRQPRAGGAGPRPARDLDHAADRAAAPDVLGQERSQAHGDRGDRERRLAARGDRQDLLRRGRRLAFLRAPAHGAGGLSAAHHPSVRHSRRRGARGGAADRGAERQVAGEDAGRLAPSRRYPAARLPGARPAAGGAEAAQRGVLRLRLARGLLLLGVSARPSVRVIR